MTDHINEGHKKIKNHKCEECGYAANAGNLKVHITAVHKKIRNVVWDECGYAASGKSNLTSHIKGVHQKIKDYVCGAVNTLPQDSRANKTRRKFLREQQEKPPFMILVLETIKFTKAGERNIWNLLLLIKNCKINM